MDKLPFPLEQIERVDCEQCEYLQYVSYSPNGYCTEKEVWVKKQPLLCRHYKLNQQEVKKQNGRR